MRSPAVLVAALLVCCSPLPASSIIGNFSMNHRRLLATGKTCDAVGVGGILADGLLENGVGVACCPQSCGLCGGPGCSQGTGTDGVRRKSEDCCGSGIQLQNKQCFIDGPPPCVATPPTPPECSPGHYQNENDQTICKGCPAARYQNENERWWCKNCPGGWYQSQNRAENCKSCGTGTYLTDSENSCTSCPSGRYQNQNGQASCKTCPGGRYQHQNQETSCTKCPVGHYQDNNRKTLCKGCFGKYQNQNGKDSCKGYQACVAGKYKSGGSAIADRNCPACGTGKYQNSRGRDSCKNCPSARYQNKFGQTICKDCSIGKYQDQNQMPSCKNCSTGTYQDQNQKSLCKTCDTGFTCADGLMISHSPTEAPSSSAPSASPTSEAPSASPSDSPSSATPSASPSSQSPSLSPSKSPLSASPSASPSSAAPSKSPSSATPSASPSKSPASEAPSSSAPSPPPSSPPTDAPIRKEAAAALPPWLVPATASGGAVLLLVVAAALHWRACRRRQTAALPKGVELGSTQRPTSARQSKRVGPSTDARREAALLSPPSLMNVAVRSAAAPPGPVQQPPAARRSKWGKPMRTAPARPVSPGAGPDATGPVPAIPASPKPKTPNEIMAVLHDRFRQAFPDAAPPGADVQVSPSMQPVDAIRHSYKNVRPTSGALRPISMAASQSEVDALGAPSPVQGRREDTPNQKEGPSLQLKADAPIAEVPGMRGRAFSETPKPLEAKPIAAAVTDVKGSVCFDHERPISLVQALARSADVAMAMYNFDGDGDGELSVRKGDRVGIVERGGDWVFVCSPDTGETGYVPKVFLVFLDAAGAQEGKDRRQREAAQRESCG